MQNNNGLRTLVSEKLRDFSFIVVSNREPYIHTFSGPEIKCRMPASSLTVALDPVMQACRATWVASGGGDADALAADSSVRMAVPPENPTYRLRRIWLAAEDEKVTITGLPENNI